MSALDSMAGILPVVIVGGLTMKIAENLYPGTKKVKREARASQRPVPGRYPKPKKARKVPSSTLGYSPNRQARAINKKFKQDHSGFLSWTKRMNKVMY